MDGEGIDMTGAGPRVLIVEHDEGERNVLSLMLRDEGYHVHTASEEGPALEELKRRRSMWWLPPTTCPTSMDSGSP